MRLMWAVVLVAGMSGGCAVSGDTDSPPPASGGRTCCVGDSREPGDGVQEAAEPCVENCALAVTTYQLENATYASVAHEISGPRGESVAAFIDLGDVPVHSTARATFSLRNDSTSTLTLLDAVPAEYSFGADWLPPAWRVSEYNLSSAAPPVAIPAFGTRLLEVAFAARQEGPAEAVIKLVTDADSGHERWLWIKARGVYHGAPDIQVEYNGVVGPAAVSAARNWLRTL